MMSLRAPVIVLLGCFISSTGCLAEPLESEGEDVTSAEQAWISMNGVDPAYFWDPATQSALMGLSHTTLVHPVTGEIQSTPLLATPQGQELLSKVVHCAMPEGTLLKHNASGFYAEGALGLAEPWAGIPLDWTSGQRWMTSCLLQFLNGVGVHVEVNMTGYAIPKNPAQDTSDFKHGDATMFGNMFEDNEGVYACHLDAFEAACGVSSSAYLNLRICGSSPVCGITPLGKCSAGSCELDEDGNSRCRTPGGEDYIEAITTTLEETSFMSLYRGCQLP